ncbi:MAG: hypothetical protein JSW39_03720 [Desulfobacterales bacterium]|nr:MAG: hypothetical protein JSW39_03720 [Desulfobacterales bacterium]
MKEFDADELAKFNGENGAASYIAHEGKVYDVSQSKLWRQGLHMKRHPAGRDLTTDIQAAPHEADVLQRYPQVGILKKEKVERELPQGLSWLLARYPMLRRHPHPMTVHFPIVFMFSTTVFNLLYLISGVKSFETTALHCLGGGILFSGVAITTGLYTWWLNYLAKPLRPVRIKIPLSILMLVTAIVIFLWRLTVPEVLDRVQGPSIIYLLLVVSLSLMVTIIGWNGAAMTFPIERE